MIDKGQRKKDMTFHPLHTFNIILLLGNQQTPYT